MTRKRWIRLAGAAVLTSGLAAGWSSPGSAQAVSLAGPCRNLDPVTTQGALLAFPNNARPWDQIQSVTTAAGPSMTVNGGSFGGSTLTYPQLSITVETCATSVPVFPEASTAGPTGSITADTGAAWTSCLKLDPTEGIVSSASGVIDDQLNDPPTPNYTFTGPFPANQGWRFCAFATMNANEKNDSGVSIFDAIGQYNQFDQAALCDNASNSGTSLCNPTYTPATFGIVNGFFTITMNMPYDVVVTTPDTPTFTGNGNGNVTTVDHWIKTGDTLSDLAVDASASVSAATPSQLGGGELCEPFVGCLQGIVGLSSTVDYLPGYEVCSTPIIGCSKLAGSGLDLGLSIVDFPIGALRTPINYDNSLTGPNGVTNPCLTPLVGGLTSCVAVNTASPGPVPGDYVFDYGRLPYGTVPGTGALLNTDPSHADYTLTFQYQDYTGDTFTG